MGPACYDWSLRICLPGSIDSRIALAAEWAGGAEWRMGDSHWYGDYVACVPFAGMHIRICDFPERVGDEYRYRADVRVTAECSTPMEAVDAAFRKVLAEIAAHGVREIE